MNEQFDEKIHFNFRKNQTFYSKNKYLYEARGFTTIV